MSETATPTDKQSLRTSLQALAARLGKPPTVVEMHEQGRHHPETYVEQFGSWEDALEAAGLDPDAMGNRVPDRELLAELQRLDQELEGTVKQGDMDQHGKYSATLYQNRFGSWSEAKRQAMVDTYEITDSALIRELHQLADEFDCIPKVEDMQEHGEYAPVTYHRRFGSWVDALDEAGLLR